MQFTLPEHSSNPTDDRNDDQWFRQPTPREHRIAAGLFIGFGVFFILLFIVLAGWWFRWIILLLGVFSCGRGIYHALSSRRPRSRSQMMQIEIGRTRRWTGLVSYVLAFVAIAAVLTWLLARFTNSTILAISLVTFMIAYMLIMGCLASRHTRR